MTRLAGAWLENSATQAVCAMLETDGKQALFVGGCVRNTLLGAPVSDIDISTDARPERVIELAEKAGFKAVPTGIDHGTITVVANREPHEVTTFRRDVQTDGRRAVIAYSDRIEDDAARRDFTMNALYARRYGTLIDPLGGLPDLWARRVRFIGDAGHRIREDYLRSLRYFRFHAWYGDPDAGMDAEALAAISAHLQGLDVLSRERVAAETVKLLSAPDPAPSLAAMRACGALGHLVPGADDRWGGPLAHLESETGTAPDPMRRLAILGDTDMAGTLRLSRAQSRAHAEIRQGALDGQGAAELGYRLGATRARDALLVRAAAMEHPVDATDLNAADQGAQANFPVTARDLMPAYQGQALGKRLKVLEDAWIGSGFSLGKTALLALPGESEG